MDAHETSNGGIVIVNRVTFCLSPPVAVEFHVVGEVGGYEVGAGPVDYAVEVAVVYCGNAVVEIIVEKQFDV